MPQPSCRRRRRATPPAAPAFERDVRKRPLFCASVHVMCACPLGCAPSCVFFFFLSPLCLQSENICLRVLSLLFFSHPRSPRCGADDVVLRRFGCSEPFLFSFLFSISHQASVLHQPTSPPPPCPASSRPSSTASPASRISPTDTRPWRRCTPTACRPTPPRAPRRPTPSSKPSPGCSSTQVWGLAASVYYRVYYSAALVPGKNTKC